MDAASTSDDISVSDYNSIYTRVLEEAQEVWRTPSSLDLSMWTDSDIQGTLSGLLGRIAGIINPYILDTRSLAECIDLIWVQVARPLLPTKKAGPQWPIARAAAGSLAPLFAEDFYSGENYPFLDWPGRLHYRVKILGQEETHQDEEENTLVTTLENIEKARACGTSQEEAVQALLRADSCGTSVSATIPSDWKTKPEYAEKAAWAALYSTEYTRRLMKKEFADQIAKTAAGQLVSQHDLPHEDERNLVFVPVLVAQDTIGGAAIFSHHRLPLWAALIMDMAVRILLYRVRSGDDIAVAELTARYKAKWETVLTYVHRLAHDVRKPAQRAKTIVDDLVTQYTHSLPEPVAVSLKHLGGQLEAIEAITSTSIGTSLEDLRAKARSDARVDQLHELLEDAVWVWRIEAETSGKVLDTVVKPDPDAKVKLSRHHVVEVLGNLVSNAVRAARHKVVVTAVHYPDTRRVTFSVNDDGPGIDADIRGKMMIADVPDEAVPSGLGLRLSRFIVTELLDAKELEIDSAPSGVTVHFTIPEVQ